VEKSGANHLSAKSNHLSNNNLRSDMISSDSQTVCNHGKARASGIAHDSNPSIHIGDFNESNKIISEEKQSPEESVNIQSQKGSAVSYESSLPSDSFGSSSSAG